MAVEDARLAAPLCEGENIHPAQVEAVINQVPGVEDSIVVGLPDAVRGKPWPLMLSVGTRP